MTKSIWQASFPGSDFGAIAGALETDVAVVGAGITGLTTALELRRRGKHCVVLDHAPLGRGVTGRTSAHLTAFPDPGFSFIERHFGEDAACRVAALLMESIDFVEAIAALGPSRCHFRRQPAFVYAEPGQPADWVEKEELATRRAGLSVEHALPPLPFSVATGFRIERQASFHPIEYLAALAKAAADAGAEIYGGARLVSYEARGDGIELRLENGVPVRAKELVLATHTPLGKHLHHSAMKTKRSYVASLHLRKAPPDGLFYDAGEPYHYLRREHLDSDVWLVGGEDHVPGQSNEVEAVERLVAWARERFDVVDVDATWSAQVYEPADGLPFVGRPLGQSRISYATGYAGDGLTYGTVAGRLLAQMLTDQPRSDDGLLAPKRLALAASAKNLGEETLTVGKNMVLDRIHHADRARTEEIPRGEGRIVRSGLHQLAVYRDENGGLHTSSARCPHMGGVVHWNRLEKTWDCPCHGSRFDVHGRCVEGPSLSGLAREDG